jgi:hypothetical protein
VTGTRSRSARLGGAAVALLALLGGVAPPAQGTTVMFVGFVATLTLATPIGYPCVGTGGTADATLCPAPVGNTNVLPDLTLTLDFTVPILGTTFTVPNPSVDLHHNKTTVTSLSSSVCADDAYNFNKPGKAPTHTGGCSFGLTVGSLPNTVAGNCGLSSGQVAVLFTDDSGQAFFLDIHFLGVGGSLFLDGHFTKLTGGQKGKVFGPIEAIPPLPPPGGDGSNCLTKTAKTFTLVAPIAG